MLALSLMFCLFVGCFSYEVVLHETPPMQFEPDVAKLVRCTSHGFKDPIYRWGYRKLSGNYYQFDYLSGPDVYIKFDKYFTTGYIVCQVREQTGELFYNSTPIFYYVKRDSASKQIKITHTSPLYFERNVKKTLECKAEGFVPDRFQWINATNGYQFGNKKTQEFTFEHPTVGVLICGAFDKDHRPEELGSFYFYSSQVQYSVGPRKQQARILHSSPIHFNLNESKTLECKPEGFLASSYQWINATNGYVFGNKMTQQFRFENVEDGYLRCGAIGIKDSSYTYSDEVRYFVTGGQSSHERNTLLIVVSIAVALAFNSLQKLY